MQRPKLPEQLERQVLIKNRHCCCICQKDGYGKEIEIHHIDGKNSHNVIDNLAVLCLVHHSQADAGLYKGKSGSGKKLKPAIVKSLKMLWERKIEEENKIPRIVIPVQSKKILESLYFFEIRKVVNEILSDRNNFNEINSKFSFLDQLVLEERITGTKLSLFLSDAYRYIITSILGENNNLMAIRLGQSIFNLSSHYLYPGNKKLRSYDTSLISSTTESLIWLCSSVIEFYEDTDVLTEVSSIIYKFGEIVYWNKLEQEKKILIKELKEVIDLLSDEDRWFDDVRKNRIKIIENTIAKLQVLFTKKINENELPAF